MASGQPQRAQGTGPPHGFFCLAYSPSGALLVGGTVYGTLYVWDASSGEVLSGPLQGHMDDYIVTHLCFVTDVAVLSSSQDATVRQWNTRTGEPIGAAFTTHGDPVWKVASLPDKKTAASITKQGDLSLWRLDTLEIIRRGHVMLDAYHTVTFSSDGTKVVSLHFHILRIYNVENCRLISEVDLKPRIPPMLLTAAFSLDASRVFFGCGSDSIMIWDINKEAFENEVLAMDCDGIPMETICSPNGTLVASSSDDEKTHDCKIRIWSTVTRELVKVLNDGGPFVFTPDSKNLTYVLRDTELSVNPLKNIKKVWFSFVIFVCH